MTPEAPDMTRLGAPVSPGRPQMHRFCAIRAEIAVPTEFPTGRGHGRSLFPISGGAAAGADWTAALLPGGADFARLLDDGSYEVEARYLMRLDDGTQIMVLNAGRMEPQADGSYAGRTQARLEVSAGPRAGWGDLVLFGTAWSGRDDPGHVYIELWHAQT